MIDFDKILEDFQPETFQRKGIRKWWMFFPGVKYIIQLDAYASWMEELLDEMQEELNEEKEKVARSGCAQYLADAEEWGVQWNDTQRVLGIKDADLIRKDAQIEVLEVKLKQKEAEKEIELQRKDKEISYLLEREDMLQQQVISLQQQLLDYETGSIKLKTRDSFGRFANGESKEEKEEKAYFMHEEEGKDWFQIADALKVKPDTAKQYAENFLRRMKRLLTEEEFQRLYGKKQTQEVKTTYEFSAVK